MKAFLTLTFAIVALSQCPPVAVGFYSESL